MSGRGSSLRALLQGRLLRTTSRGSLVTGWPSSGHPIIKKSLQTVQTHQRRLYSSTWKLLDSSLKPFVSEGAAGKGPELKLNPSEYTVSIRFKDGSESEFHGIWLRDHCKCPACFHPITQQRLLDTYQISFTILPTEARLLSQGDQVEFKWPDGHVSRFELDWLRHHSYGPHIVEETSSIRKSPDHTHHDPKKKIFWGSELVQDLPTTAYSDIMDSASPSKAEQALAQWLEHIENFGIGFVQGVPPNPQDTESLIRKIAFIRETHYGGFWDFTSNLAHGDTAYTNLALPAHTDTTYFTDPAGLQCFHLLSHDGQGGQSLFVDGFKVAKDLLNQHPSSFEALTEYRLQAHSAGDSDTLIQPLPKSGFPILNLDPLTKELYQVRFNNDDRSPSSGRLITSSLTSNASDKNHVAQFYKALKDWMTLLRSPSSELWISLKPGTAVMFNNWRVLHGRASFTGKRRLCGAYVGMDDYKSRVKMVLNNGSDKKWL